MPLLPSQPLSKNKKKEKNFACICSIMFFIFLNANIEDFPY